jgi:hypothetical protein
VTLLAWFWTPLLSSIHVLSCPFTVRLSIIYTNIEYSCNVSIYVNSHLVWIIEDTLSVNNLCPTCILPQIMYQHYIIALSYTHYDTCSAHSPFRESLHQTSVCDMNLYFINEWINERNILEKYLVIIRFLPKNCKNLLLSCRFFFLFSSFSLDL